MGAERTVGFLVDDLDAAVEELRAAGIETDDEVSVNERWRYLHFRAPDGQLYELVEPVTGDAAADR
jgi:glyoxylase I family protein